MMHSIIGKGSPHKAGTNKAHGAPLGIEEVAATKIALGIPEEPFYIPQSVTDFFRKKIAQDIASEEEWKKLFGAVPRAAYSCIKQDSRPKTLGDVLRRYQKWCNSFSGLKPIVCQ